MKQRVKACRLEHHSDTGNILGRSVLLDPGPTLQAGSGIGSKSHLRKLEPFPQLPVPQPHNTPCVSMCFSRCSSCDSSSVCLHHHRRHGRHCPFRLPHYNRFTFACRCAPKRPRILFREQRALVSSLSRPGPAAALGSSRSSRPSPLREGRHGPDTEAASREAKAQTVVSGSMTLLYDLPLFAVSAWVFSVTALALGAGGSPRLLAWFNVGLCRLQNLSRRSKVLWLHVNQRINVSLSCVPSRIKKHQLRSRAFRGGISPGISSRFLGKKHEHLWFEPAVFQLFLSQPMRRQSGFH